MVVSNNIVPGLVLSVNGKLYRVEASVKVTVPKGTPFIKTTLVDLADGTTSEKNFKVDQNVKDVALKERRLEYLYPEGKDHLFLDIGNLEQVLVPAPVISEKVNYLKEGVEMKASFYDETILSVELPQFLELMVVKVEAPSGKGIAAGDRVATLETGAKIMVPPFIEIGDIIKVDTQLGEYIQRV